VIVNRGGGSFDEQAAGELAEACSPKAGVEAECASSKAAG
jgi:hypothetical protein